MGADPFATHWASLPLVLLACLCVASLSQVGWMVHRLTEQQRRQLLPLLLALAIGVMLADAALHLMPAALAQHADAGVPLALMGAGGLLLWVVDQLIVHRHRHRHRSAEASHVDWRLGPMSLVGDGLHNLLDGVLIGTAFALDPWVGLATTAAVCAHELPQELGDAGALLHAGFPLPRAMRLNAYAAACVVPGALLGWSMGESSELLGGLLLPLLAGSLVYLALVHLLPALRRCYRQARPWRVLAAGVLGVLAMQCVGEWEAGLGTNGHKHGHRGDAHAHPPIQHLGR